MQKNQIPEIKKYDFRRPPKFSVEQVKTLHMIFETFCRLAANDLSIRLRASVAMNVSLVDQCTLKEFLETVASPGFVSIFSAPPLKAHGLMELTPDSLDFILDWLLGGWAKKKTPHREVTDIELFLMEDLMKNVLSSLKLSFGNVVDMNPRIGNIETNPQFMNILPPNSMVMVIKNEISIGDVRGSLNVCLPYIMLESIMDKLSAQYWYSSILNKEGDKVITAGIKADAQVVTPCERKSISEIFALKKGSLLRLPGYEKGEAHIRIGGSEVVHLKLAEKDKGQGLEFRVEEQALMGGWDFLSEDEDSSGRKSGSDQALKAILTDYTQEIGKSISALAEKVSEIADQQNVISEQWHFKSGVEEVLLSPPLEQYPFSFLNDLDAKTVAVFLNGERVQLCALVLSYMEKTRASEVLALMQDVSADIVERIATLSRVQPAVVKLVEDHLKQRFTRLENEAIASTGGFRNAMEILSHTSRGLEKSIIENLEKTHPDTAAGIRRQMFEFEDIMMLNKPAIQTVVHLIDEEILALALHTAPQALRDHLLENLNSKEAEGLQKLIRENGQARLHEIENARGKIVDLILNLAETGEIVLRKENHSRE